MIQLPMMISPVLYNVASRRGFGPSGTDWSESVLTVAHKTSLARIVDPVAERAGLAAKEFDAPASGLNQADCSDFHGLERHVRRFAPYWYLDAPLPSG